jgi:predicted metal-binding membrane protein
MVAISRDRAIVLASVVAIAGLAWAYLFALSQGMSGMDDMPGMVMPSAPTPFLLTATMWTVMMIGMMLPSATPMILLFTMVQRKQGKQPVRGGTVAGQLNQVAAGLAIKKAWTDHECTRIAPTPVGKGFFRISGESEYSWWCEIGLVRQAAPHGAIPIWYVHVCVNL